MIFVYFELERLHPRLCGFTIINYLKSRNYSKEIMHIIIFVPMLETNSLL